MKIIFRLIVFLLCANYVFVMHWLDLKIIGPEMTFTLIYLIPISIAAWFAGMNYGIIIGLLCSLSWLHVYFVGRHIVSLDEILVTNIVLNFLYL